jgi:integrase
MFEVAYSYGWRRGTLRGLKVGQIDFPAKTIRLYDTKNGSGLPMVMTGKVNELLTACCDGKGPDDFVFTRNGKPIVEYRKAWERARDAAGCPGLLLHDLCRTGMRNMRRLGISESVAMKVAGRKTPSIFRRYDIVDESDLREVARKLDEKQQEQSSHSPAIAQPQDSLSEKKFKVQVIMAQ